MSRHTGRGDVTEEDVHTAIQLKLEAAQAKHRELSVSRDISKLSLDSIQDTLVGDRATDVDELEMLDQYAKLQRKFVSDARALQLQEGMIDIMERFKDINQLESKRRVIYDDSDDDWANARADMISKRIDHGGLSTESIRNKCRDVQIGMIEDFLGQSQWIGAGFNVHSQAKIPN